MNRRRGPGSRGQSGDPRKRVTRAPQSAPPRSQARRSGAESETTSLLDDIDRALADPHPIAMLALASGLAATLDPDVRTEATSLSPTELPPPAEFIGMLASTGELQTDALAWVLGHLVLDDLARARALRIVDRSRLPGWLVALGNVEVSAAWQSIDVLRDGTNVCFGVRVGDFDLTMVVFIDFNNAGAVKDGFLVPGTLAEFQASFMGIAPPDGIEFRDLDVADARAQVEAGLAAAELFWPPFESDSWPQMQPLLEFVLRFVPAGGEALVWPTWTQRQADDLVEAFFHSDHGRVLTRNDVYEQGISLWIDFATRHGFGDPLLISGSKMEIFLLDSGLQTVSVGEQLKAGLPAALRAFVPFAHAQRGIESPVTAEALATLDRVTPTFLAGIDLSGPPRPYVPLTADGNLDLEQMFRQLTADEVGGLEQLERLDDTPLPSEELELADVADDLHGRLRGYEEMAEEACRVFTDREVLTAVRRLTHDIAVADPEVFRRRAKDANTAAALCLLVARANGLVGSGAAVPTKNFLAQFGVTSVTARASTLRAVVVEAHRLGGQPVDSATSLGSPRYLTGTYRTQLGIRLEARLELAREHARKLAATD